MEFPREKFKPKKDSRSQRRGGPIKFLYIACAKCDQPIMMYQKDGLGGLIRCYADRIAWPADLMKAQEDGRIPKPIVCSVCGNTIGNPMIYEPEKRLAYRIIPGSIHAFRRPMSSKRN